jgi:CheY-like chemotaxis protein
LYLDDNPDDLARFPRWVERAWNQLISFVPLKVDPVGSLPEALEKLRTLKYRVFLTDISFGPRQNAQPLGLDAIVDARIVDKDLAIVAISIADAKYEQRSREVGADGYVSKQYLLDNPEHPLLAQRLLEALRAHGHEPLLAPPGVIDQTAIRKDFRLSALVETVGKNNVANFAIRALKQQCSYILPTFVRSGYSGAAVLKIDCTTSEAHPHPSGHKSLLLKMSRDSDLLALEMSKDMSRFPSELFVPFTTPNGPLASGQWFAIAAPFKHGAETLLDWLSKPQAAADVHTVLDLLFSHQEGLGETYSQIGEHSDLPNVVLWGALSPSRRARVFEALTQFQGLADKHDRLGTFSYDL